MATAPSQPALTVQRQRRGASSSHYSATSSQAVALTSRAGGSPPACLRTIGLHPVVIRLGWSPYVLPHSWDRSMLTSGDTGVPDRAEGFIENTTVIKAGRWFFQLGP